MKNIMTDPDIQKPFGVTNSPLVMVVSSSPVYQDSIQAYLLDANYLIAGPFSSVDRGHSFLRRQLPDLIVFDAITTQDELFSFSSILRQEAQDIPVLVLHHADEFSINHNKIEFVYPPIDPVDFEKKVSSLLDPDNEKSSNPLIIFNNFINQTLSMLLQLAPDYSKVDMEEIITQSVNKLTVRNSEVTSQSEETFYIQIKDPEQFDLTSFSTNIKFMLLDIIEAIDNRMESTWGSSLVEDALQAVTLEFKQLPQPAVDIVEELGKGYNEVINKFQDAVPDFENLDRNLIVSKLLLTDWGPELRETVSTSVDLKDEFTEEIASQLITLVGQGSKYHQGIYGPVPIPRSEDVIAIIWSKLIKSDIKDERMEGNTLVLIAIGFRKSILNLIPNRQKLETMFSFLDRKTHEKEISEADLKKIAKKFIKELH